MSLFGEKDRKVEEEKRKQLAVERLGISKKEYAENYCCTEAKDKLNKAAIFGYICAGINMLIGLIVDNFFSLIFGIGFLGLALGFHIGKSKACAIVWLVLAGIDSIIGLFMGQTPAIWLIFVGIWAIKALKLLDEDYEEFKAGF